MPLDGNLYYIISTALKVGDFDTALPWLEAFSSYQISELTLPNQRTPLHYACQHGRVDVARRLITNCQCSIESKDVQGCTPLHTAAQYGQVETLKYLLHKLFNHEVSSLTVKLTPGGKLSHTLASKFQQKLSDKCRDRSGNTALHTACVHGQLDIVQLLTCEIGCDPVHTNREGLSCLHLAAQYGHLPLVRYLMEEVGSDVTLVDEHGRSPTYLAAGGGHLDILKYLIEEGNASSQFETKKECGSAEFNMAPGRSLVHTASREGHLHVVRYLVEHHGCDPSSKDGEGFTPLYLASLGGHIAIVSYLITEAHCDPHCISEDGKTCLHSSSIGRRLDVIRYFHINHNCQIKCDSHGWTPLHYAASQGALDVLIYLIEDMKCDPDIKGQRGGTPLSIASEKSHLKIVKYLVDTHHCDPLCPDEEGQTPFHRAAASSNLQVVSFYAATQKCNLLVKNKFGDTPLHVAALNGHLEVVMFLTEDMKCDPDIKGQYERTPLHHACQNGHLDVMKYFIDTCHCNPLCPDEDKQTPLHLAAASGKLNLISYFSNTSRCNFLVKDKFDNTPLHLAVLNGHLEVVKFFIKNLNFDSNIRGQSDMTPLHSSLWHRQIEAKISRLTNTLHLAVETQNLEIVSYLCNTHRLDPHLQPDKEKLIEAAENPAVLEFLKKYTDPLHYAAIYGGLETVKHYVEREKWDPMKEDRFGNNTLHNAALHGQLEVVKFLTGLNKDPIDVEICDPLVKNKHGLTAQDIASQNGHRHVMSYLLRASLNLPDVLPEDIISPPFNILVVGNSGSGKSTLVEALPAENSRFRSITKVRGVIPQTAGIVLTTFHSRMYGEVNIYDFAGHEEYYASHEMILQQTAQPLVLVVVNASLPEGKMQKQILYWLSMLSSSSSKDAMKTIHVLIIGSHADQIKFKEKLDVHEKISSLMSKSYSLKYHGNIQCDCRYSVSDNLNKLRLKLSTICRSIRLFLAHESYVSNSLCAALMSYVKKEGPAITVHDLHKSISDSLAPASTLVPFVDQNLLLETCKKLSSMGHTLFFPHDENEMEGVLVVEKHTILSKVHACLRAKGDMANEIGVIEEEHLKCVLSDLLQGIMQPTEAIKYLIFSQFCTKITANQLISVPQGIKGLTHYFFPSLASTLRPDAALLLGDGDYTHLYTWGLRCTDSHQFLTPRYLHSLFIQLTKCEGDAINARFIIWKNGILLVHNNGTRSIIEVTEQTTHLYLTIQCIRGCQPYLLKQRSKAISLIKSLLHKICPLVTFDEFLLLPQTTYPLVSSNQIIPLADIAHSVVYSLPTVLFNYNHIPLRDLLHFDPFHAIDEPSLQELFHHRQCMTAVSSSTLSLVCSSIEGGCEAFAKGLSSVLASTQQITYELLYEELSQYSIFTDGNLYVSSSVLTTSTSFIYTYYYSYWLVLLFPHVKQYTIQMQNCCVVSV